MDFIESANKTVNSILDTHVYGNPVISSVLSLFLVLYAGLAAPKLPKKIAKLFGNEVFRIVVLICIAYMASKDASMSIISAVALVLSLQTLSYHEASEVVSSTIADEAANLQVEDTDDHDHEEDHEEYVFDESEEVEPVFKPEPEAPPASDTLFSDDSEQIASADSAPVESGSLLDSSFELEQPVLDSVAEEPAPANIDDETPYEIEQDLEPTLSAEPVDDEAGIFEDTEVEDPVVEQPSVEESPEETTEEPAIKAKLPQGDDTDDHPHAGYHHDHPLMNENSAKIRDNSNKIDELAKLIKKQKVTLPEEPAPSSEYNVSPFGGESYAKF